MKTNQKGITIIALIITIIITMILATVTIQMGTGSVENSRLIGFVTYMQTIQAKVDFIVQSDGYLNYGEELSNSNKNKLQTILNSSTENLLTTTESTFLRYFDSNHIASDLEIQNIDDEIIIDFKTREVISLNGVKYDGQMYYTQYNLPGGQVLTQQTDEIDRTVEFGTIISNVDGLNATFTIEGIGITNGTLSYGKKGTDDIITWTEITNYTSKGKTITTRNVTESGTYYFKLVDNVTGTDNVDEAGNYPSVNLRLTNTPKLQGNLTDLSTTYNYTNLNDSTKWAFATDISDEANLVYYVWIPRFAYQLNGDGTLKELQFLRGTSDITTSGGYINSIDWTIPDVFIDGTTLKTGVWLQVASANQSRHRYN